MSSQSPLLKLHIDFVSNLNALSFITYSRRIGQNFSYSCHFFIYNRTNFRICCIIFLLMGEILWQKIYGGGSQTNINGLKFEQETDLK